MDNSEQALCIVNTRRHARGLYKTLSDRASAGEVFHLSTLMCPAHRKATLAEIRERLNEGLPCRVVSTQIMEAGIDVDFPVGFRAMAGLDSIIQAAGRVNRENRRPGICDLTVFEPDSEFVDARPDISDREGTSRGKSSGSTKIQPHWRRSPPTSTSSMRSRGTVRWT